LAGTEVSQPLAGTEVYQLLDSTEVYQFLDGTEVYPFLDSMLKSSYVSLLRNLHLYCAESIDTITSRI